jgi:hypothetical protein
MIGSPFTTPEAARCLKQLTAPGIQPNHIIKTKYAPILALTNIVIQPDMKYSMKIQLAERACLNLYTELTSLYQPIAFMGKVWPGRHAGDAACVLLDCTETGSPVNDRRAEALSLLALDPNIEYWARSLEISFYRVLLTAMLKQRFTPNGGEAD